MIDHRPYSINWKGGVPVPAVPKGSTDATPVWSSGYPAVAAGYAANAGPLGRLRAFDVSTLPQRNYTRHVAVDTRHLNSTQASRLQQSAGRSPTGGLPHYERVDDLKDLQNPIAEFKQLANQQFQQVRGAPMPLVPPVTFPAGYV